MFRLLLIAIVAVALAGCTAATPGEVTIGGYGIRGEIAIVPKVAEAPVVQVAPATVTMAAPAPVVRYQLEK